MAGRFATRTAFFALFLLAPVLDLFRLDLTRGHFVFLGMDWTLGLRELGHTADAGDLALRMTLRAGLPLLLTLGLLMFAVWRWGRIYCGWLCPHFSMVEWIDAVMQRWLGRRSLWERRRGERRAGARLVVAGAVALVAALWAVTLLSYLVPPLPLWRGLFTLELPRWQWIFVTVATALFAIEFTLARHFFCKYGCAVGIFQSLIWMANRKAMVVGYDAARGRDCRGCHACDEVCPMRLPPRGFKRAKFTCTQCAACIQACATVQADNPDGPLLNWVIGQAATELDRRPRTQISCPSAKGETQWKN